MSLKEIQNLFSKAIRTGSRSNLGSLIIPGGKLSVSASLEVYEKAYPARLSEALSEIYETIWWILGDANFFEACEKFIRANDSISYNLSNYGRNFPDFLRIEFGKILFIGVLADFELIIHDVFHGEEDLSIPVQPKLKDPEELRLKFNRSCQLISNNVSVYPFWKNRKDDPLIAKEIEWNKNEFLILHKKNSELYIRELSKAEFTLVSLLKQGRTLQQAIEKTAETFELSEQNLQDLFRELYATGVVTGTFSEF
ncbi:MAG: DNA-binding domain-containing protein [Leptospira sp.]|nr:DNA-binding domain-containing protein [Leptospira sp.]